MDSKELQRERLQGISAGHEEVTGLDRILGDDFLRWDGSKAGTGKIKGADLEVLDITRKYNIPKEFVRQFVDDVKKFKLDLVGAEEFARHLAETYGW